MISQFLKLFKREYKLSLKFSLRSNFQTLNKIEIARGNLIQNYKYLAKINRQIKIAPVLKSNAYGHGLVTVARILDQVGAPFFCVDSLYEAYELLRAGIKTPILIMGYTDPRNFKVKKLPFSYAVFDMEMVTILGKYQPGCGIHLFVDTGMNREGISLNDLPQFLNQLKQFKNLKIEGLMSHLASADNPKDPLNKIQIKNFKKAWKVCSKSGIRPRWIHLLNSDGLLNIPGMSTPHIPGMGMGNLARTGLALYGISSNQSLKPALTLKSKIIQIKKLRKGDRVGYGGTFTVKKEMILGVLPAGYYDGVDRRLSNKGFVTVDDIICPIIGHVSMNITTVDLSRVQNPYVGQEVIVYSDNPQDKNSIARAAKICQTISYDLLVNLAQSTKRVVI